MLRKAKSLLFGLLVGLSVLFLAVQNSSDNKGASYAMTPVLFLSRLRLNSKVPVDY